MKRALLIVAILAGAAGCGQAVVPPGGKTVSPAAEVIQHEGWHDVLTYCSHGSRIFQASGSTEVRVVADPTCAEEQQ